MTPEPAWARRYPELGTMLAELTDGECQQLDGSPVELAARVASWLPSLVPLHFAGDPFPSKLTKFFPLSFGFPSPNKVNSPKTDPHK